MRSVFDPGHGLFSSVNEVTVAALAFLVLSLVGVLLEYTRDTKGWGVMGAAVGVALGVVLVGPPGLSDEWHYVFAAAIPVALVVWLYRGRRQ
jgi:hypothetical protein